MVNGESKARGRASEDAYENLEGRRLEALARLFAQNVRIYVYPMTVTDLREWLMSASSAGWEWTETNGWVSASQLRHAPPFGVLFAYLSPATFLFLCEPLRGYESRGVGIMVDRQSCRGYARFSHSTTCVCASKQKAQTSV